MLEISTAIAFASCSTLRVVEAMSTLREVWGIEPLELLPAAEVFVGVSAEVAASVELLA